MLKKYFQLLNIISFLLILSGTISAQKFSPPEWSYDKAIYEVNIRQYTEEGNIKHLKSTYQN
jgi:hypothetical protein